MNTKALLDSLDLKSIPCEFCDVRIEETFETQIRLNNSDVTTSMEKTSSGAFLRVRNNGQWYFSSTTDLSTLKEQLINLAQSPSISESSKWSVLPENLGDYNNMSYEDRNPSQVPLSEKVQMMQQYCELMSKFPKIKTSFMRYQDIYKVKTFKNSSGTSFQYDFTQCGWNAGITFADGDKSFSDYYNTYAEYFSDLKDKGSVFEEHIRQGEQFIHAPLVNAGKHNVVLSPYVAGIFVHESFGHNSEADTMIGDPNAKEIWKIGKKVAADFVSIVDSGLHKGGSGYCPIDDEGFKATKTYLIKDGVLSGRLHSLDTAVAMNERPTGNGRAINFEYEPIVRMTSTYIENGNMSLGELLRKSEGALYVEDFNYGTGGDLFTIAPGRAYLIKDGKPSVPVRANVISGQLFETLLNIEAAANDFNLHHSALGGCGKLEQFPLPVSDGGPTILVKDMQVS